MSEEYPKSFREAIAIGSDKYKTGKKCKHGHISARYTSNKMCIECMRHWSKVDYNKHKKKRIATKTEWRNKNMERVRATARAHYADNKEKYNERKRRWREENRDKIADFYAVWNSENKDKIAGYQKKYRESNPERASMLSAKRRGRVLEAIPPWADMDIISAIYVDCRVLTDMFGEKFTVDHIVPLQGENVCGLHVQNNLQILPFRDNSRKSNRLIQDLAVSDCHWIADDCQ